MRAPMPPDSRGFLRREWCERRRSRSGPDQRFLSHIASAGCQIRHDGPPAVVADEIERDVAGDDDAERFELAAQIGTLGPIASRGVTNQRTPPPTVVK